MWKEVKINSEAGIVSAPTSKSEKRKKTRFT